MSLSLFDKLAPLQREMGEQFAKAADDKKKAVSALHKWGDIYHLGGQHDFHSAPSLMRCFRGFSISRCRLLVT